MKRDLIGNEPGGELVVARCLFCGAEGKLTREHLYGPSFADLVDQNLAGLYSVGTLAQSTSSTVERKGRRSPGQDASEVSVRLACSDCNSGWLNDLHASAHSIIEKMLAPGPTVITGPECFDLARWVLGRAMVLSGTRNLGEETIPVTDYASLSDGRISNTRITVYAFTTKSDNALPPTRFSGSTSSEPTATTTFQASLQIQHLLFVCVGTSTNRWYQHPSIFRKGIGKQVPSKAVRLWPEPRKVKWPPSGGPLGADDANEISIAVRRLSESKGVPPLDSFRNGSEPMRETQVPALFRR